MEEPNGIDLVAMGRRIRAVRTMRGRSQREVAEDIGVAQTTYSCYERGRIDIPLTCLVNLAGVLDVSVSWLLGLPEGRDKGPL